MSHSEFDIYQSVVESYGDFSKSFSFVEKSNLNRLSEFKRLWENLIESLRSYIEWRSWKLEERAPMTLEDSIESNYVDFLIINASSSLESALKDSIIFRLEKEMHGISKIKNLVHFIDYLDKETADYYDVQNDIVKAIQGVVPLRGANPGMQNIKNFIKKSSAAREKKFCKLIELMGVEQYALAELVKMRNDIAHQNARGYVNPDYVAYCVWNSLEISRIVVLTLLGEREFVDEVERFEFMLQIDDDGYRDFVSDMRIKHGKKTRVSNVFGDI